MIRPVSILGCKPGSTPPNPYHAPAVVFDGTVWLSNASSSILDTPYLLWSIWVNYPAQSAPLLYDQTVWAVDPAATAPCDMLFNRVPGNDQFHAECEDTTLSDQITIAGPTNSPTSAAWHSLICGLDSNLGVGCFYIDRVPTPGQPAFLAGAPFNMAFTGLPFWFANDSFGDTFVSSIADFVFYAGTNFLNSDGSLPAATLAKFVDSGNKPMDPSGFPPGYAILFSGDSAGFPINQGSSGTFSLTGTLTNASTSPSD